MSRKILIFLGALLICAVAGADEVQLRADHPQTYTVQKGDTLWDISGRFLTQPWQWPQIWESNPQIANPDLIYPGDVLVLDFKDGKARLRVADRNVKLSPSVRETRHADIIHAIPLDAVQQFLSRPRVVTEDELDRAGYIVGSQDEHLTFGAGHRVYVRNLGQPTTNKFSIFRKGGDYVDPGTHAVLGYEAEHIGDAIVEKFGDPATVRIVSSVKEAFKGDRLLPQQSDQFSEFIPHAPSAPVDGKIISVIEGFSQIGQHQVVVVNKGVVDGLEAGHVLAIYQEGEVIADVIGSDVADRARLDANLRAERENPSPVGRMAQSIANDINAIDRIARDFVGTPIEGSNAVHVQLPEERAGELMVFRTFDQVSYGLVMNVQRPIYVLDNVRNP